MIELIPVVEIGYNNQGLTVPNKYPYWNNSEIWDEYHNKCYLKAGFKGRMMPYLAGSSFFKISEIAKDNLTKLIIDHTEEFRNGKYDREQVCSFFGGYVLRVEEENKYYPQCCGTLSDISYWEALSNSEYACYEGHPEPQIIIDEKNVILDFTIGENDEFFEPPVAELRLKLNKIALKQAVERVKEELDSFAVRIKQINEEEELNIENIAELLIGQYSIVKY